MKRKLKSKLVLALPNPLFFWQMAIDEESLSYDLT